MWGVGVARTGRESTTAERSVRCEAKLCAPQHSEHRFECKGLVLDGGLVDVQVARAGRGAGDGEEAGVMTLEAEGLEVGIAILPVVFAGEEQAWTGAGAFGKEGDGKAAEGTATISGRGTADDECVERKVVDDPDEAVTAEGGFGPGDSVEGVAVGEVGEREGAEADGVGVDGGESHGRLAHEVLEVKGDGMTEVALDRGGEFGEGVTGEGLRLRARGYGGGGGGREGGGGEEEQRVEARHRMSDAWRRGEVNFTVFRTNTAVPNCLAGAAPLVG